MPGMSHPSPGGSLVMSGVIRGLGSSLIIALALTVVTGLVYFAASISEQALVSLLTAINVISVAYGGLVAAKAAGTHGWLNGGFSGLLYVVFFSLFVGFGWVPSTSIGLIAMAQALILGFAVSAIGGIIGVTLS